MTHRLRLSAASTLPLARISPMLLSFLLVVATSGADTCGAAAEEERPNIVLIMADDMGYGDISPYDGWIKTPHLQTLARQGVRLTDFHSSGNVCSPTRAGLMTGRYQQRAGIPGVIFAAPDAAVHQHGLQDQETTIAESFRAAGYRTAMFGKWHLGYYPRYNPVRHGFDEFRGYVSGNIDFHSHFDQSGNFDWWQDGVAKDEPGYVTHLITRHAVDFIQRNKDKPFFLYLPHEAPHYPFQGPSDEPRRSKGRGRTADWQMKGPEDRAEMRRRYRQMVEELDASVGAVVDALEQHKLTEKTLVFFISDNGAAGKYGDNTPLRGAKGSNWEGGHRVPGIVKWPGQLPAGVVRDDLCISLDVMPTALAACKIPLPRPMDGINLLPMLSGEKPLDPQRELVWNGRAIRQGSWKLIVNGKGSKGTQLFDLSQDLSERHDLAEQFPDRVAQLKQRLEVWKHEMAETAVSQPERAE